MKPLSDIEAEILKEWVESPAAKRVNALEASFSMRGARPVFDGETIPEFISRALQTYRIAVLAEIAKIEMKADADPYIEAALAAKIAPFDRGVDYGFELFRKIAVALLAKECSCHPTPSDK